MPIPRPNPAAMKRLLDHDNHEMREGLREVLKDPVFTPIQNLSVAAQREVAMCRLERVAEAKLFGLRDFYNNPNAIFAAHELFCQVDQAATTKSASLSARAARAQLSSPLSCRR